MSSSSSSSSLGFSALGSIFSNHIYISSLIEPISDEDFLLFHNYTRKLFSLLIFSLGCEVQESTVIMAFLIWLQLESYSYVLVRDILENLSPFEIFQVSREIVICLKCILQDEHLLLTGTDEEVSNLQKLLNKRLRLAELYERRVQILRDIRGIVDLVCNRAFKDIIQGTFGDSAAVSNSPNEGPSSSSTNPRFVSQSGLSEVQSLVPRVQDEHRSGVGPSSTLVPASVHGFGRMRVPNYQHVVPRQMMRFRTQMPAADHMGFNVHFDQLIRNQQLQHRTREIELEMVMSRLRISEPREEIVPADDRSLFLTFSRGYPVSESEVRFFFTWKFGNFIEAIFMHNVPPYEQALYARVVARSPFAIVFILGNEYRRKFTINGKHVWVRRYEKDAARTARTARTHT